MQDSGPPLPPGIAAQQSGPPPLQAMAQRQAGNPMASAQGAVNQPNSSKLVDSLLSEIAQRLEAIAKIMVQEKPNLVPLLKPVVQGLAMLQNEVKQDGQGQDPNGPPAGGPPPPEQDQAGASGGAAMAA